MRTLVLGGSGFLSRVLVEELLAAGHQVTTFTRGHRPVPEGATSLTGDRTDHAAFAEQLEGRPFDAVIDCLCFKPEDAASALRVFAGRVSHYLMVSTDFVYGPQRAYPMDEDTPTFARNQYGREKAACEEIFLAAHREEGFPATILRPPHIMGAGGHLGSGSLQARDPMLVDRLQQGEPVVLLDGGQLLVQPVYHRDIAQACLAVLGHRDTTMGQAYNVAGPDVLSSREYYDLIAATLGVTPRYLSLPSDLYLRAFPEKAPFAHHRTYSTDKLARDTGYRPETSVAHAVFEMIDWLQANEAGEPYRPSEQDEAINALSEAYELEVLRLLSG